MQLCEDHAQGPKKGNHGRHRYAVRHLPLYIRSCPQNLLVRIAVVPLFSGLRRFPQGRHFKQWTGDDSKALMKVRSVPNLMCTLRAKWCFMSTTGIPACHRGLCTRGNNQMYARIPGCMLHFPPPGYRQQFLEPARCCLRQIHGAA